MEEIKIDIAPDGTFSYIVKGIKGGRCKTVTKALDGLSTRVLSSENTGEACQVETQAKQNVGQ